MLDTRYIHKPGNTFSGIRLFTYLPVLLDCSYLYEHHVGKNAVVLHSTHCVGEHFKL